MKEGAPFLPLHSLLITILFVIAMLAEVCRVSLVNPDAYAWCGNSLSENVCHAKLVAKAILHLCMGSGCSYSSKKTWFKMLAKKDEEEIFHQGALMDAYKEFKCGQELCLMPCTC